MLLALAVSLALHGWLLSRQIPVSGPRPGQRSAAVAVRLKPLSPGGWAEPLSAGAGPQRKARRQDDARPHLSSPPRASGKSGAVPEAEVSRAPTLPEEKALAESARTSVGAVMREMSRQEGRLDPNRGLLPRPNAALIRSAVAEVLEKQFGRPVPFVEESIVRVEDGSAMYRIRTEKGSTCFKELPANAVLSMPGQGNVHQILIPVAC